MARQIEQESRLQAENEKLPQVHQDVVRVITLQMAQPDTIKHQLFATVVDDGTMRLADPMPQVTVNIWEQKAGRGLSENPDQMILPGGKIKHDNHTPVTTDQVEDQARRELWTELHLNPSEITVLPDGLRTYDFIHHHLIKGKQRRKQPGRLFNTERLAVAVAAPFDRTGYFDPRDNLQAAIPLSPMELHTFLTQEYLDLPNGTRANLYDSLSSNETLRERIHMHTDGREETTKQTIEERTLIYEAYMQGLVIERLLNITRAPLTDHILQAIEKLKQMGPPQTRKEAETIMRKVNHLAGCIERKYVQADFGTQSVDNNNLFAFWMGNGISKEQIQRRMLLISELETAHRQVAFNETAKLTEQSGPQQPFILAQVLLKFDRLDRYEYQVLKKCPSLRHILDTMCDVFHDDISAPDWYTRLEDALRQFRENEYANPAEYRRIHDELTARFCKPRDERLTPIETQNTPAGELSIEARRTLGNLSKQANDFLNYVAEPVKHIADQQLLEALLPDPILTTTSEIPELLVLAFTGVDQYEGTPLPDKARYAARYAALRKLLDMLDIHEQNKVVQEQISMHIKPLRQSIFTMLGTQIGTRNTEVGAYHKYQMRQTFIDRYKNMVTEPGAFAGIDFSALNNQYIFTIREKDFESAHRKHLERGGLESDTEENSDIFGFLISPDDEHCKREIVKANPHLEGNIEVLNTLASQWTRWATQLILVGLGAELQERRQNFTPNIRFYKGRWSSNLNKLISSLPIPIEPQDEGSSTSDAKWDWVKFAIHLTDTTGDYIVEIQLFPNTDRDLVQKKMDDERYWIHRTFNRPAKKYRYPLMTVFFGVQDAYDEVMRRLYQEGYTHEEYERRRLTQRLLLNVRRLFSRRRTVIFADSVL